jgi:hypothetical protein
MSLLREFYVELLMISWEYALEKGLERSPPSQKPGKIGPSNCLNQPIPDTLGFQLLDSDFRVQKFKN